MLPKAIPMSRSVALHAAPQEKLGAVAMVVTAGPSDRCTRRYALNVAKIPRYHLNPAVADRYIVASATVK